MIFEESIYAYLSLPFTNCLQIKIIENYKAKYKMLFEEPNLI